MTSAKEVARCLVLATLTACGDGGESAPPAVPSGQVDPGYGIGGKVESPFSGSARTLVARDGSAYLVVGNTVRKVDANGARVMSYGEAGEVRLEPSFGTHAAINDRGEVFATLLSGVAKVDAEGRPDPGFGENGRASLGLQEMGLQPFGLAIDAADNVYLFLHISADTMRILKVDRRGRVVMGYGLSGAVDVARGPIAIDAHGFAYIANSTLEPRSGETRVAVTKLDPDGGTAGDYTRAQGQLCASPAIARPVIDGNGNILVGGSCAVGSSRQVMLFKLDSRGAPVPSFRAGLRPGIFGEIEGESTFFADLAWAANGDIFVAGSRVDQASGCGTAAVAKLDADGNAVATFGRGGVVDQAPLPQSAAIDVALDGAARLYAGVAAFSGCHAPRGILGSHYLYRLGA